MYLRIIINKQDVKSGTQHETGQEQEFSIREWLALLRLTIYWVSNAVFELQLSAVKRDSEVFLQIEEAFLLVLDQKDAGFGQLISWLRELHHSSAPNIPSSAVPGDFQQANHLFDEWKSIVQTKLINFLCFFVGISAKTTIFVRSSQSQRFLFLRIL
jgi:hypothetical protein